MQRKWLLPRKLVRQVSPSKINKSTSASKTSGCSCCAHLVARLPLCPWWLCMAWGGGGGGALSVSSHLHQLPRVPPFSVTLPTPNFFLPNSYYVYYEYILVCIHPKAMAFLNVFNLRLFNSCSLKILKSKNLAVYHQRESLCRPRQCLMLTNGGGDQARRVGYKTPSQLLSRCCAFPSHASWGIRHCFLPLDSATG